MINFELLSDKVKAQDLRPDDYVIVKDQLWHVINNFPVLGGAGRMLMLAYHTHVEPKGYNFHHVTQNDLRFEVFRKIQ
jgi:hypothetical protein